MTPNLKVGVLTAALVACAVALMISVADLEPIRDVGASWWQFALAFALAERFVAHVEIREQAHTLSLSETVILLGLVLLDPISLVCARVAGAGAAMALRRLPRMKFLFNGALFACEAALASVVLHRLADGSYGPTAWAIGALAVLAAGTLGTFAVVLVISFFDTSSRSLFRGAFEAQLLGAAASVSLAVVGVTAVEASITNAAYVAILLGALLVLLAKQAATTQRAGNLESIGRYAAGLVGLNTPTDVIEASLREAANTMRATHAALVVGGNGGPPLVYRLECDAVAESPDHAFLAELTDVGETVLLSRHDWTAAGSRLPDGVASPLRLDGQRACLVVWQRSTGVGRFTESNLSLFSSLVGQAQVALDRAGLIDQLHFEAHHDALTGLPNRLGLADKASVDAETIAGLLVLDLDRFKDINDTLGHPTGDRVLEIVAERLAGVVRTGAVLARLGGDEFAVYDPACGCAEEAAALAQQISACVEDPIAFDDLSLQVGASIGIALAPAHGQDLTTLMSHADAAMYAAKREHVGWKFYRPEDDTNDPRRLELVSSLKRAISAGEIEVWYQPTIRLQDGSVCGAEALARWEHHRHGRIRTDEFIELAEGAGLMRNLTDAVLTRVIEDLRRWERLGPGLTVAVNLSTRNLLDETLPSRVDLMLRSAGVSPQRLSFEITETAIMIDRERVTLLLDELRSLGIRIAIDDYGTGYSSLAYLRELSVDVLKIDRSFVTGVDLDPHNEVIVRSTINLAHSLGLAVVAEGVEREGERSVVEDLGCDYAQGYLFSRPIAVSEFEAWLTAQRRRERAGDTATAPMIETNR